MGGQRAPGVRSRDHRQSRFSPLPARAQVIFQKILMHLLTLPVTGENRGKRQVVPVTLCAPLLDGCPATTSSTLKKRVTIKRLCNYKRVSRLGNGYSSFHPETPFFSSPSTGEGRVRVIMVQSIEMFCFAPPHPNPLPQGERGFPDGHYSKERRNEDEFP